MTTSNPGKVQHINPDELVKNPAFTNIMVTTGHMKIVCVGGQDALDTSGAIIGKGDIQQQTEQVLRNLQAALSAGGAELEHIIKWNTYVVQGQPIQPAFEVFQLVRAADLTHLPSPWCS